MNLNKKNSSFILISIVLLLIFSQVVFANGSTSKVKYLEEIEKIKTEEIQYHIKEFKKLNSDKKISYAKGIGISEPLLNDEIFSKKIKEKIEQAYIYYMDENGNVYNKNGFLKKLDITSKSSVADKKNTVKIYALPTNPSINGAETGAFVRQTTYEGYMGSRTEFRLPTKSNNEISQNGFIYNGLIHDNSSFDMEGGLQYSYTFDNYSAYIGVNGGALLYLDDSRSGTNYPPRFKSNTWFISNLRYEPANSKIKYYASGTNVNNESQLLIFSNNKSFTTTQRNQMRARRVTGLAEENYDGTQNIGNIDVTYSNSTLLKSNNTSVNYNTSYLDEWLLNGKIMGTVDWPSSKITKTPTSGDISNQRHIIDTRN